MSATAELAGFAAKLTLDSVPDSIVRKLEDHALDTLGVMCTGLAAPASEPVERTMSQWSGTPECTIVGTNRRAPPPQAAFLNAFHGRVHTFDDTIETGPVHPGSSILAATLATAEAHNASGSAFLAALLAGYEVVARIVAAFGPSHYGRGFHTTGTCNVFGAAAAAARILNLDSKRAADALGIAGGMASGLRQYQIDGAMSDSALNGAHAALAGVLAADLASNGLPGPVSILDGKYGLGTIAADDADFKSALRTLGSEFLFAHTAIKPYPTCRFTHGPLHELARLQRKHRLTAEDVQALRIETFRQSIDVSDKPNVASRTDALLSHQTSAALLLVNGAITVSALDTGAFRAANVTDLASRIHVEHAPDMEAMFPAAWPHRLTLTLRDGPLLEALSLNPPGGQADPLPRAAVEAKFRANVAPVLDRSAATAVAAGIRSLANGGDLAALTSLLCGNQKSHAAGAEWAPVSVTEEA